MRKSRFFTSLCMMIFAFSVIGLAGCGETKSITITQELNITEVKPGDVIEITADLENIEAADVDFVVNGDAVITNAGVLTVNTNATVGETIEVYAQSEKDDTESNTLTFAVVDLMPSAISLSGDAVTITKNSTVTLTTTYTPAYATVKAVTYSITEGSDIAEIVDGNKVKIKNTASPEENDTIMVSVAMNAVPNMTDTLTITYVVTPTVETLMAENVVYNVATDSNKSLVFECYNPDDILIDVAATHFSYLSSDPTVATIGNDGTITPLKHGKTTVTITHIDNQDVTTTCTVYVVVTPESIDFAPNSVSTQILTNKELTYSKVDALELNLVATREGFTATQNFTYEFEDLDDADVESEEIATVEDNEITFLRTGNIKVIVKSDSSIAGLTGNNASEADFEFTVHVNNGTNIKTVQELHDFGQATAQNSTTMNIGNIVANIILTDTNNFGKDGVIWRGPDFYYDVTLNGNGYAIDATGLTCETPAGVQPATGEALLTFWYSPNARTLAGYNAGAFEVNVVDLNLIGQDDANTLKHGFFNRAIYIHGADYTDLIKDQQDYDFTFDPAVNGYAYAKDPVVKNVNISGFNVGIRISHGVDAVIEDVSIQECYQNGIELDQCHTTLKNLTFGQLGGFGVDIGADDLKDLNTANPTGTAGENYNETPTVKFEGNIASTNFNNGSSTDYMSSLALGSYTIPVIMQAIIGGTIDFLTSDPTAKAQMQQATNACLYNSEGEMNFYLLVFIDITTYTNITQGNCATSYDPTLQGNAYSEGVFLDYDASTSDVINMSYLLQKIAQDPSWEGYKNYRFIQMDLDVSALGYNNLGQIITFNQAYVAPTA